MSEFFSPEQKTFILLANVPSNSYICQTSKEPNVLRCHQLNSPVSLVDLQTTSSKTAESTGVRECACVHAVAPSRGSPSVPNSCHANPHRPIDYPPPGLLGIRPRAARSSQVLLHLMTRLRVGLKGSPAWREVCSPVTVRRNDLNLLGTASNFLFDLIVSRRREPFTSTGIRLPALALL